MSLSTIAAARQNEMNDSITVVATNTGTAGRSGFLALVDIVLLLMVSFPGLQQNKSAARIK